MKQSKDIIKMRRKKLIQIINERKTIENTELAKILDVSLPTLRRDINFLYNEGIIQKKHGTVEAIDSKVVLKSKLVRKKELIAKYAASIVDNDDTIFINSSDTSIKLINYIEPSKFVSVVTNNGKALTFNTLPNIKLILTGGDIKLPKTAMTGEFAIKNVNDVQANKAILGASGFDIKEGMTTANLDEVAVNKAMIKNANKVILCVDSSKLNHVSAFISGRALDFNMLITDTDADKTLIDKLKFMGLECVLVDIDENKFL